MATATGGSVDFLPQAIGGEGEKTSFSLPFVLHDLSKEEKLKGKKKVCTGRGAQREASCCAFSSSSVVGHSRDPFFLPLPFSAPIPFFNRPPYPPARSLLLEKGGVSN